MKYSRQKGAVAPFVAILLVVIVICVALVVDLGHVHNVKGQLQRAVDAAALSGARYLPTEARVSAVAIATAGANTVDSQLIATLLAEEPDRMTVDVAVGSWDHNALGSAPLDRWTTDGTPITAVKVRARRDVNHFFFFFLSSTEVVADAIALAEPTYPILPLAVVSCIPTSDVTGTAPGTLPDLTVCGVVGHEFSSDPEDLAAWSSLTMGPASATNIIDVMGTDENFELFNQIVFGRGLATTDGIENDPVSTSRPASFSFDEDYAGCVNDGINIDCGLGKVNAKEIAPPDDFLPPAGIPPLQTGIHPSGHTYYIGDPTFDPLAGYAILPRWYNISDNSGFDDDDHFIRVISQDGILLKGPTETDAEYAQRLIDLNSGALRPYGAGDDRFTAFVDIHDQPDFLAAARYAGYPKVHVMNGVTGPVLEAFLKRLYDTDDKKQITDPLPCSDNKPFPDGEKSVRVNVPVIFAGNCDNWKAVDASDFTYIGMAKFLMTRAELKNTLYACADGERANASSCSETFAPPLDSLGDFGQVNFNAPAMIEGVYGLPTTDDDKDQGGLVRVFLVE